MSNNGLDSAVIHDRSRIFIIFESVIFISILGAIMLDEDANLKILNFDCLLFYGQVCLTVDKREGNIPFSIWCVLEYYVSGFDHI